MRAFFSLAAAVVVLGASPAAARAMCGNCGMNHGGSSGADHSGHGAGGAAGHGDGHAAHRAAAHEIAVTREGFVPSSIKVKRGEHVRLVVTRKTDQTCAKEIVIEDYAIREPLPLNEPVTIEFTPTSSGEIRYACSMDMVSGVLTVE